MRQIHGIRVAPSAPPISTLFFADDTLIFRQATEEEAGCLKHLLQNYERAFGQLINFEKSTVSLSKGIHPDRFSQLATVLGVRVVHRHDRYLGMLAVVGKSKKEVFSFIKERVWKRINGWGESTLSSAGKEVLIKAVLQSIPTYIMCCFRLPKALIRSLEAAVRAYWWGNGSHKKITWVSW